jgi:hypothetical protein
LGFSLRTAASGAVSGLVAPAAAGRDEELQRNHSDQERILESELHRFVRFRYDVVVELARAR